jgi:ureidoacrylate peracid hydrolase
MAGDDPPADLVRDATWRRGGLELFDRLDPTRAALMVIDMQNAWLTPGAPFETPSARALIPRVNALASALRRLGGLVVWIQHTTAPPGTPDYWALYFDHFIAPADRAAAAAALLPGSALHDLHPALDARPEDSRLRKFRFSAFVRNPDDPEPLLRSRGVDTLIVVGTATNVCVESTVRDAMMRDFRVFAPHDAVAAPRPRAHLAGLGNIMQSFADVRSVGRLLALMEGE